MCSTAYEPTDVQIPLLILIHGAAWVTQGTRSLTLHDYLSYIFPFFSWDPASW